MNRHDYALAIGRMVARATDRQVRCIYYFCMGAHLEAEAEDRNPEA